MREVVAASGPSLSKIRIAASRMASTVTRERACCGLVFPVLCAECRAILKSESNANGQEPRSRARSGPALRLVPGHSLHEFPIMILRFREDWRTLFWAFGLMPLVPALAYLRPALAPWLVPLALYASYCSGVLAHNQNHSPTFVGRRANAAFSAWLSVFYGFPLFAWVPTHNQNHHRYLNGE